MPKIASRPPGGWLLWMLLAFTFCYVVFGLVLYGTGTV